MFPISAVILRRFLFECVGETIKRDLPNEVRYLQAYDKFVSAVESFLEMPKKKVDLLWRFLDQNNGKLSARARAKEFAALRDEEVSSVERAFAKAGAGTQAPEQQEPAEVRQGERGRFRFLPGLCSTP